MNKAYVTKLLAWYKILLLDTFEKGSDAYFWGCFNVDIISKWNNHLSLQYKNHLISLFQQTEMSSWPSTGICDSKRKEKHNQLQFQLIKSKAGEKGHAFVWVLSGLLVQKCLKMHVKATPNIAYSAYLMLSLRCLTGSLSGDIFTSWTIICFENYLTAGFNWFYFN